MTGTVLVLGADENLARALELIIQGIRVKVAPTAVDTEGIGIDVVVIAGQQPLQDLTEVRVHPHLHDTPVVLVTHDHPLGAQHWGAVNVWPVTRQGYDFVDELAEQVAWLVSRAWHPSARRSPHGRAPVHAAL
jgi:hypothetical protein